MTTVPFLDLRPDSLRITDDLTAAVRRVVLSGRYLLGPETEAFEREWAAACGAEHAVTVGSGLAALVLSLRAHGIGPGDDVLVPSFTFQATWTAVEEVGARVIPVEADPDTGLVGADAWDAALTPRTTAVIPVHLYGAPADPVSTQAFAQRHGLLMLQDAAQAHGARWDGRSIGAFGDAAWSFYPGKNLGALGDGGAITTDDPALAAKLRRLRNYGSERKYHHVEHGTNSRLDEVRAAGLRVRLSRLERDNSHRRQIAARYDAAFHDHPAATPLTTDTLTLHARHLYVVPATDRPTLMADLASQGIETLIHYPIAPHQQPTARGRWTDADLPVAATLAGQVLSLPIGPHLTDEHIDHVVTSVTRTTGAAHV